ncbi:MAG: Gfo/Idh/MocA family oxidoreductase [Lentisphaeria bacterium]|nr:Gfo/Idh/MocA family oxidoreductase [Lentisphaeria bacterium]
MVKCGIIGCGVIAPTHIEGYRALPEAEVVHLCDLIPERVGALGEKYGVARRSTDYRELLADPEVEAVSVCTDHASHARIVADALAAGRHVICEKALGRVPEDLSLMVNAAKAHPELVASGIFQHRYEPANRRLRKLIADGKFGRILAVNLVFSCLRTNAYYEKDAWRGTMAGEGGGILINQAIHHLDQLRYLFGNAKRLVSRTANLTHQGVIEVEDTAAFLMEFDSGVFGTVAATNSSSLEWRSFLTIVGTEANLEYANEKPVFVGSGIDGRAEEIEKALTVSDGEKGAIVGKKYYGAGHTAQLADFIDAIGERRQTEISIADAADSAALVMAVYESGRTGGWVDIPAY